MAFEETIQQIMYNVTDIPNAPDVNVLVEYSAVNDNVEMTFNYSGEKRDASTAGDKLSIDIVKSMVTNIEYTYLPEETLPNRLVMIINNESQSK